MDGKTNFLAYESTNHPQLPRLIVDESSPTVTWTADYLQGVPKVGSPGRNRRLVWRLSLCINGLEGSRVLTQDNLSRHMLRSFSGSGSWHDGVRLCQNEIAQLSIARMSSCES